MEHYIGFFFLSLSLCCVSVCLFRPEARRLTNCGWLVLAWMSAGELLFYFAESPLTFISLHLLRDGDAKWQGLLSLFLLCLSVCPFSLSFFLTVSISLSLSFHPSSSSSSSSSWARLSLASKPSPQLQLCASSPRLRLELHKVNWTWCAVGPLEKQALSVRDIWRETAQDGKTRVKTCMMELLLL